MTVHLKVSFLLLVNLALVAAAVAESAPPPVKVETGLLQGMEKDGVVSFLGVPFAAPPVGELRWRAPQAPNKWQGVRRADHLADDCTQNPPAPAPPWWGTRASSEDCLYLNLWTPSGRKAARLPVMVFIPGGGYNIGGASWPMYDGTNLARRGVVLVTINYRLGKFGFFAHPALTKENPEGPLGNYGILDQIAALEWVKRNVANFGGDPKNVTIFGESAGGGSVLLLMESPLARGLFHKAIVESGGGRGNAETLKEAESAGQAAAKNWGLAGDDAAALRKVPAAEVLGNDTMDTGPRPIIDGKIVPESAMAAFQAGQIAHVPLLIGTNSYEAGLFPDMVKETAKKWSAEWPQVMALYDPAGTAEKSVVETQLTSDAFMTEPALALATAAARAGLHTYLYMFSYLRPSERGKVPGAIHFDEVYAIFDTMSVIEPNPGPETKPIVEAMQSDWVEFARSGQPAKTAEAWPAFTPEDERLMEFTNQGEVVRKDLAKDRMEFIAQHQSKASE